MCGEPRDNRTHYTIVIYLARQSCQPFNIEALKMIFKRRLDVAPCRKSGESCENQTRYTIVMYLSRQSCPVLHHLKALQMIFIV